MKTIAKKCMLSILMLVGAAACADVEATEAAESTEGDEQVLEQNTRDPNKTYIEKIDLRGTGCPKGSFDSSLSEDGLALTLTFSEYSVNLDQTTELSKTLNCTVYLSMHVPQGYQYAVSQFSYSGYAYLGAGAVAQQTVQYAFQGVGANLRESRHRLDGPHDDSYLFVDRVDQRSLALDFSPCGETRELQLRTSLGVTRPSARVPAYANTSSVDVNVSNSARKKSTLLVKFKQQVCRR